MTERLALLLKLHAGSKRRRWPEATAYFADEIAKTRGKNTDAATLARVMSGARQEDAIRDYLREKIRRGLFANDRWLAGKVVKGLAGWPPRAGGLKPAKLPSLPKVRDVLGDIEHEMKNRARNCPQTPTAPNTLPIVVAAKAA